MVGPLPIPPPPTHAQVLGEEMNGGGRGSDSNGKPINQCAKRLFITPLLYPVGVYQVSLIRPESLDFPTLGSQVGFMLQ